MPEFLLPHLGLGQLPVPGVVIYGGRQSMRLARWLQESQPVLITLLVSQLDLAAGLVDRWIVATFEDQEAAAAATTYEQRKQLSQGLHFLLVQLDDRV